MFWGGSGPNDQGLSRKHLVEGTMASLERLGMDYVDLLFCHRPDPETPIEETVRAMSWLVNQGKAFYWGSSQWSAEQIRMAHAVARQEHLVPPTMEQPQYNMFVRDRVEREFTRLYRDVGLGLTVWSPLSSGLLTGKYNEGIPEGSRLSLEGYGMLRERVESEEGQDRIRKVRQLAPIAEDLGATLAQLAIAWTLRNPDVSTTITGASRPEQVDENMAALDLVPALTPDVVERIESVLQNRPEGEKDYRE
jgi:voltage-dependent potassium channel beta subunit